MSRSGRVLRIAVIGAAVSANKGAASMFYGLVDGIAEAHGPIDVQLLTTYPSEDRRALDRGSLPDGVTVSIVNASPVRLLLAFLAALPVRFLDRVGLPIGPLGLAALIRSVRSSDVVVDLAGISFADGRGIPLLGYNSVMSLFPYFAGGTVVKGSQALGPMHSPVTRAAARFVLPRMHAICARGAGTRRHLDELGLTNVVDAADISFLMSTGAIPEELLGPPDDAVSEIVVMPSAVVDGYAARDGIDHIGVLADVIAQLSDEGHSIVVVPHSFRSNNERSRMNDGPIVADLESRTRPGAATFHNRDLDPRELRALAARADLVITGRFHGMVSALEVGTIPVVIGWSHKYGEVLEQFGVPDQGLAVSDLTADSVVNLVHGSLERREELEHSILAARSVVEASSRVNIDVVLEAAVGEHPERMIRSDSDGEMRGLQDVIDQDWCIGCGACVHADDSLALILDPTKLMYRPSDSGNDAAVAVCPAVEVDYGKLQEFVFGDVPADAYGVVDSVLLAQSTDHDRNMAASSGGMIKELLRRLLTRDDVVGAIALSHVEGLDFSPTTIADPDDVDTLPGSIYHNLDQSGALTLLKEAEGKVVLVGIPCVFEGIFKYIAHVEPELKDKIAMTIGLLCGWQYTHHSIEAMGEYLRYDPNDIVDVAYRGGGPIGKYRVTLADGSERSASRRVDFSYQVAFDRHFNTRRCHVCVNHSNFLADLVVGDAWLPSTLMTRSGISLIVARTPDARAEIDALEAEGSIVATEVSRDEIRESQTDRVIFGEFAYAYADFLRDQSIPTPRLEGPNRGAGTPAPRKELESFHREYLIKTELQRNRQYRRLWWRKATKGAPQLFGRYWRWFTVRVLRVKSIKGERKEVSRSQLSDFR